MVRRLGPERIHAVLEHCRSCTAACLQLLLSPPSEGSLRGPPEVELE